MSSVNNNAIPVIDISSWMMTNNTDHNDTTIIQQQSDCKENVINAIHKACCDIGFFIIVGHGIKEASVINRTIDASKEFFNLPMETKLLYKSDNNATYPYGFENNEKLHLGKRKQQQQQNDLDANDNNTNDVRTPQSPPTTTASAGGGDCDVTNGSLDQTDISLDADKKETYSIGPYNVQSGMPPRRPFPTVALQNSLELYYQEMEQLSVALFRIFALALQLPEDWFLSKMTHHCSALRILNYFPIQYNNNDSCDDENDVIIRASAHTDYGAFTILKACSPGLQVKKDTAKMSNDNDDDGWINVPVLENAFVINLGDLMPRWTNDKWVSTLHRVIVPRNSILTSPYPSNLNDSKSSEVERRQSIAYFCNVNGDTVIETIETCIDSEHPSKYVQPITAIDHLMSKHLASMSEKLDNNQKLPTTNDASQF